MPPDLIETVAETGSTNADLIARLRAGERPAEGHWLLADRQTSGRGRQGRAWFDGSGNFMGSTAVHIGEGDPPAPSLALVAALALREAVIASGTDEAALLLKWPNDLLLGRAKLAGILLEGEGQSVVIGMGVNLASAPAISGVETADLGGTDRDTFVSTLAGRFADELARWRRQGLAPLIARWLTAAHPVGTPIAVHEAAGERISGTFAGLDEGGALLLRLANGEQRIIHAGDVTLEGR